jgi:hypothetical protein
LTGDAYQLLSLPGQRLLIVGGSAIATLYGAYKFLQSTGIGFALDEDLIPDEKITTVGVTGFHKTYKPAFALRGIQPFHDFPEGPDWWNEEDYKAIITQLPKMGMNFIGFHTYPWVRVFRGWYKPEPIVWIGTKGQFDTTNGRVQAAYPVLHANTNDSTWDYYPEKTTDFSFGAAQLFETADYGADYMKHISAWPHTSQENVAIFNKVGTLLDHAFTLAGELGVKTCIGTETPLTIPGEVRQALLAQNKDSRTDSVRQEIYEALFSRIKAAHPLDYYWFWTPEDWTWGGERPGAADAVERDLSSALAAVKKVKAPFTLATCGWVLGPQRNRAEFDQLLPKDMPFAVINRQQGYAPVEPAFAQVKGRPKWEISWMEDDPALICPQFWVGRTLKDAQDAWRYGCTGLMGIHWRTQELSPTFLALAKAGWEAGTYTTTVATDKRDYPAAEVYDEWALSQFGEGAAKQTSAIFQRLDGAVPVAPDVSNYTANFPRSSIWGDQGPGLIIANPKPWVEVAHDYDFISDFEQCAALVKDAAQVEHYQHWLQVFYYAKALARVGCLLGQMDTLAAQTSKATDTLGRKIFADQLLATRNDAAMAWGEMVTHLLQTVNTTGSMGTIANLEQHNLQQTGYLVRYDSLLNAALGEKMAPVVLSTEYKGPSRVILTTRRTLLRPDESLDLRVRVLTSAAITSVTFFWKPLGAANFEQEAVEHEGAHVYHLRLLSNAFQNKSLEYYIAVKLDSGETLQYPVGDHSTQTVVVW